MYASIPNTYVYLIFCMFFFFFFSLSLTSSSFRILLLLPLTIHSYPFIYHLPCWDFPFLLLYCFWLLIGVLPGLPTSLPATQPLPLLRVCWLHHSPFLDKIACFVFTSLCFHFTPPDKDLALSLSLITYLYGMHPMVPAHIYLF